MTQHQYVVPDLINAYVPGENGVEIGVELGITSREILKATAGHLYLVDPWIRGSPKTNNRNYSNVCKFTSEEFPGRTTIIKKKAEDAADDVPDQLGFIFIDGDHHYDYIMKDLTMWVPKVRQGGLVMGHDWSGRFPEVIQAVIDFTETGQLQAPLKKYSSQLNFRHRSAPTSNPVVNKCRVGKVWWSIKT